MTTEFSSGETMVFDEREGINYKNQPDLGTESPGDQQDDNGEPITLSVVDRGRYKELNGPGGVFSVLVPESWSTKAMRSYDDDGSTVYSLTAGPDLEAFDSSYEATGVELYCFPLFDGWDCNRVSIDVLLDMISPGDDPERAYATSGLLWKKTYAGAEAWEFPNDTFLQHVAGKSANGRWLYLLALQGISFDHPPLDGTVISERTYNRITEIFDSRLFE